MPQVNPQLEEMAGLLKGAIRQVFDKNAKEPFDGEPTIEKKDIIEYHNRMRASAIDKFNNPAYCAAIQFYKNENSRESHDACGVVIVSLRENNGEVVLKAAGIHGFDEDDFQAMSEKTGEFCGAIGQEFQHSLTTQGYPQLVLSFPVHQRNSISNGVEFSYDQYERCEIGYSFKKNKILVVEIAMAQLAKG